jgi:hypothetical protein
MYRIAGALEEIRRIDDVREPRTRREMETGMSR